MTTPFVFGIPLMARALSPDWETTCRLLSRTILSCFSNPDEQVTVRVACHDLPDLDPAVEPYRDRLIFTQMARAVPALDSGKLERREDKYAKMRAIVVGAGKAGGGHVFMLDSDDLVSNTIVSHIRSFGKVSVIFTFGYVRDDVTGDMYCREEFDLFCGSCCAVFLGPNEDTGKDLKPHRLAKVNMGHHAWRKYIVKFGGEYVESREPHVIYIKNHGVNLSFLTMEGVPDLGKPKSFQRQFNAERRAAAAEHFAQNDITGRFYSI